MSDILRQHWQGVPSAEIGANMERQRTAEEVDGEVARGRADLEDKRLTRIIVRFEQGEVADAGQSTECVIG